MARAVRFFLRASGVALLTAVAVWLFRSSSGDGPSALPAPLRPAASQTGAPRAPPSTRVISPAFGDNQGSDLPPARQGSPRDFLVIDLRGRAGLSAGEAVTGLSFTPDGLRLLPTERMGSMTSAPLPLRFPANAVSPLWKADVPEGTFVRVEVALSADGEEFERWHEVEPDPDSLGQILPTYPDGRPNPNYGFIAGGMMFGGFRRWGYIRYRITMTSSSPASPTVEALRFFYQDTGDGS